ncbi:hypothetical protein LS684_18775 [Cytobacillus spongiae]|uniref:efflux RND transporter periplasmic adaptor subunit n=1 Tax=Cytobacillus spongiae TaxID=2901381 RepID=UPI001F401EA7|nr:hypothetical protein [Cytobacillus spongiae]UII55645.1 hypothetical protein LS684_18775 [Cytobacillus spongiae]
MKKSQLVILGTAITFFIACNFYLILKEDSKISRSVFIEHWSSVEKQDLKKTLKTEGLIVPSEEHFIYFDDQNGAFKQFLVKEGEQITPGTPLFEYETFQYEKEKETMENRRDLLNDQIVSLEDHIDELTSYITGLEIDASQEKKENKDNTYFASIVEMDKEIYNKELEKALLEKEYDAIDQQLEELQEEENRLTVISSYTGTITKIQDSLANPIISIHSETPSVQGTLTEEEVSMVESGMDASIYRKHDGEKFTGTITQVLHHPMNTPKLNEDSNYLFTIGLEGENESLLSGNHVDAYVTLEELKDVITVSSHSLLKKNHAYVLNSSGKIEKRKLELGLEVNKLYEIQSGLTENEKIVLHPGEVHIRNNSPFITPLQIGEVNKKALKNMTKSELAKYTLLGFLSR